MPTRDLPPPDINPITHPASVVVDLHKYDTVSGGNNRGIQQERSDGAELENVGQDPRPASKQGLRGSDNRDQDKRRPHPFVLDITSIRIPTHVFPFYFL